MDRAHARGAVRAHPRSRGENAPSGRRLDRPSGSSPLTRGKLGLATHAEVPTGLIPAHAGKTYRVKSENSAGGAHPRSRGENEKAGIPAQLGSGSSPLTRGKRGPPGRWRGRSGLIPAHAGKTLLESKLELLKRAHPRSRGENSSGRGCPGTPGGSSPLTRGKHVGEIAARDHRGLIPAHAGKTPIVFEAANRCRAHPRSRGENASAALIVPLGTGSSPLTRGKPCLAAGCQNRSGLIPAHAGKTCPRCHRPRRSGAHPRSRGENFALEGDDEAHLGSSPLTRGKRFLGAARDGVDGLIPAHAGKTRSSPSSSSHPRAHPRSRGENIGRSSRP